MKMNREHSQPDRLYPVLTRYISAIILLSAEEERTLALKESAEARDRLILSHLPLVKSVAFNFIVKSRNKFTFYEIYVSVIAYELFNRLTQMRA